ncbi:MAG: hypothetical protein EHM20_01515 [Alphaproteobacteria bacterium]|nr:MAG: hypothetical protein EHM20_01515 [Alphaproteobacteria bacterium]
MNRKEKIQFLKDVAAGIAKPGDLNTIIPEVVYEVTPGLYEDANGNRYTEDELKIFDSQVRARPFVIMERTSINADRPLSKKIVVTSEGSARQTMKLIDNLK